MSETDAAKVKQRCGNISPKATQQCGAGRIPLKSNKDVAAQQDKIVNINNDAARGIRGAAGGGGDDGRRGNTFLREKAFFYVMPLDILTQLC